MRAGFYCIHFNLESSSRKLHRQEYWQKWPFFFPLANNIKLYSHRSPNFKAICTQGVETSHVIFHVQVFSLVPKLWVLTHCNKLLDSPKKTLKMIKKLSRPDHLWDSWESFVLPPRCQGGRVCLPWGFLRVRPISGHVLASESKAVIQSC